VPGDGVNLLWQEVIGSVRGRTSFHPPGLDAETAKEWGAVNEIVPANKLLARAREIAEGLAKLPRLTSSYPDRADPENCAASIDEGVGYGLALEGISAAMSPACGGEALIIPGAGMATWSGLPGEELTMHSFALREPTIQRKLSTAHAQDPQLAFIAGGTDLIA